MKLPSLPFSFLLSLCAWAASCGPVPSLAQFNYYNSVLINEKDEKGDYVELGDEFLLEPDAHFSNQRVNVSLSSVQLPTNVYNKGGHVLTIG